MTEMALIVGSIAMAAGGFAIAALLLLVASYCVGFYGRKLFKDLRRIYHLSVMGYWLGRLEKGGTREFKRAEKLDQYAEALRPHQWKADL